MENTRKSRDRALYLPLLAVGVALVAAVSSWASGPSTGTTPSQSSAPASQIENAPIQNTQTTPAPPEDGRGGREDCPEKDDAASGGDRTSSTPPDSPAEAATEV